MEIKNLKDDPISATIVVRRNSGGRTLTDGVTLKADTQLLHQ